MRVLARVAAGGALLVVVVAIAVSVALPRIASSPTLRADLGRELTSVLGYRFVFEELELQLFPPSVVMGHAQLFDLAVRDEVDPFARADRIELTVAVTPLLAGIVLIDSAVVVGAQLEVVRTGRGLQFPEPTRLDSNSSNIIVRELELRDAAVVLADRTVRPAVSWKLRDVQARVFGEALDSPVSIELMGALASGGQLSAHGTWMLAGEVDLELKFDSLAIATAEPYFESGSSVEGLLTGSIQVTGAVENLAVAVEAICRGARFQLGEVALDGMLEIAAQIDDAWTAPHGQIDLDATQAKLIYADFFSKPLGKVARVTGTLSHDPDGWFSIDAWKFVMKDLDGRL